MAYNSRIIAIKNFIWRLLERVGAQGVTLLVSIIVARLVDPKAYGRVAIVTVFISVLQVFIDSGFGASLVQKKDADDLDFSSVFYVNLLFSVILYALLFVASPIIAAIYNDVGLTSLIRVASIVILISGVKNIQQAYVTKNLLFKKFFFATLGGTIAAGVVGIILAYVGFGVWALVIQNIVNQAIDTIILWLTVEWRPKRFFSLERVKKLFNFGARILGANLIAHIYTSVRQLAIGKFYSTEKLAYYNQGYKYPSYLMMNVNSSIDSVLFPIMANKQTDIEKLKQITREAIRLESYILFPILMGLGVCASAFVSVILTDKWLPIVPYMRVFCLSFAISSLHTSHFNSLKAVGRSDLIMKVEVKKKVIDFIILIITLFFGPFVVALGVVMEAIIAVFFTARANAPLVNYSFKEQVADVFPSFCMTVFMGTCVIIASFMINSQSVTSFIIQVLVGVISYVGISVVTRNKTMGMVVTLLGSIIGIGNKKTKTIDAQ